MTPDESEQLGLGLLMFIPYRHLESQVLAALRARGHDLPLHQARVFQRIGPSGSRLGELARAAELSKQTVGSIVDQLHRAGYVDRVRDPADNRARLVVITPRGRELIEISVPVVREVEAAWAAHLGEHRVLELKRTLAALREITDPFA